MESPGVRVPRGSGEAVRLRLIRESILRTDLGVLDEGETLVFPVTEARALGRFGRSVVRDFPVRPQGSARDYAELLDWPAEGKRELPRSFDVVGEVVLVRIPSSLEDRAAEVGGALLRFVPGARLVGEDLGVHGPERRRRLRRLAGNGPWRTRHRENGIEFDVDCEQAYFSPRLAREHALVAEAVEGGDRVLDLCAGVGPFSLTIARDGRAQSIVAVDMNPHATELLVTTRDRYGWQDRIEVRTEPIEATIPSAQPSDHVILNLPHEGIKYLPSVATVVAPGGELHYYAIVPRSDQGLEAKRLVRVLLTGAEFSVTESHVVHPYSPASDLWAYTLERR